MLHSSQSRKLMIMNRAKQNTKMFNAITKKNSEGTEYREKKV